LQFLYIKVKIKLTLWPRRSRGGVVMQLYSFFNLGTRLGWVVSATPRPLYPRELPGTHCTGGWVGPRTSLDRCGKSRPFREFLYISAVNMWRYKYRTVNIMTECLCFALGGNDSWDLWWIKWQWNRFLSCISPFPVSVMPSSLLACVSFMYKFMISVIACLVK
jgi:hypothetical protein